MLSVPRYIFGRVVETPGGPALPEVEQRVTSITAGLPAGLLALCDHRGLFPDQLVGELIHPSRERAGALWFWPASCDGQRYMLASALRARPESGDDGLSRRHAQAVTCVFTEAQWCEHAPVLIVNAPLWLRAEPDTVADYERFLNTGSAPPLELGPDLLAETPRCLSGPLPRPGTLLWRLTGALELAERNLVIGAADNVRGAPVFLKALACVAALLPAELRIYLTAAAGFARPLVTPDFPFALQFCPEAPALGAEPPGLLEQIASGWLHLAPGLDLEGWQHCWAEQRGPAGPDDPHPAHDRDLIRLLNGLRVSPWAGARREAGPGAGDRLAPGQSVQVPSAQVQTGAAARTHYARLLADARARRGVTDLSSWLAGRLPVPPPQPRPGPIAVQWLRLLTDRLNDCLHSAGKPVAGVGRAAALLAALIDTDPTGDNPAAEARQRAQADCWAGAFRQAAAGQGRAVLRWSALLASRRLDPPANPASPPGPTALGVLLDFDDLRALTTALARAGAESSAAAVLVRPLLDAPAVRRRVRGLRRRAGVLLIRRPRGLVDLAASAPGLLAVRPEDDPAWRAAVGETVRAVALATRLYRWTGGRPTEARAALLAAAARVAARSFGQDAGEAALRAELSSRTEAWLQILLRRYWAFALTPETERDAGCTLWRDAVVGLLRLAAPHGEPAAALALLLRHGQSACDAAALTVRGHLLQAEPAARTLFDACLAKLAVVSDDPIDPDPVLVADELLRAVGDLRLLAPGPEQGIVSAELGRAIARQLVLAIGHRRASPAALVEHLLPRFECAVAALVDPADGRPAAPAGAIAATLMLARTMLERLLCAGGALPRQPVSGLFDRLEQLLARAPEQDAMVAAAADALAVGLARAILAWADADPPQPWLDSGLDPGDAPLRRRLVRRLGFPRAVYFGGLLPASEQDPTVQALQGAPTGRDERSIHHVLGLALTADTERRLRRVLGYGAATCWRALFAHPDWRQRNLLVRLLREPANRPAAAEALAALTALSAEADQAYRLLIDEHTWFALGFFAALAAPTPPAGLPVPVSLEVALRGEGDPGAAYAVHLGRLIVTSGTPPARVLAALFERRDAAAALGRRVLLPPGGWAGFALASDLELRHGVLRLLYLLALVRSDNRLPAERRFVLESDLLRTLQLPPADPALPIELDAFLARQPDLRRALRAALPLAGPRQWPGWPV